MTRARNILCHTPYEVLDQSTDSDTINFTDPRASENCASREYQRGTVIIRVTSEWPDFVNNLDTMNNKSCWA